MTDKHSSDYSLANTRGRTTHYGILSMESGNFLEWYDDEGEARQALTQILHEYPNAHVAGVTFDGPGNVIGEVFPGPEPKVKASKQELVAALVEIRDRCGRVAEARAVARRVLGDG